MRKLVLAGTLFVLLLTSTAVLYAGVEWDADPDIGEGLYLAWSVTADGTPTWSLDDVQYQAKVKKDNDDEINAKAKVWTPVYDGEGSCTLYVWLTQGEEGEELASNSGRCGKKVKVKWESDD